MYRAKPFESYENHILTCYQIWLEIWNKSNNNLHYCHLGIPYKVLRSKSLISVLFHDIGKLIDIFQDNMKTIENGKRPDWKNNFRHEIISSIFLLQFWAQRQRMGCDNYFPYEVWAVLGHHKILEPYWGSFDRERQFKGMWPEIPPERIDYAVTLVKDILSQEEIALPDWGNYTNISFWQTSLFTSLKKMVYVTNSHFKNDLSRKQQRLIYSIQKGILHHCDWIASSKNSHIQLTLKENTDVMIEKIRIKVIDDGKDFQVRPFQQICSEQNGDVIAIAPTGSGKTEAAILWSLNKDYRRLIFLMPTMVTSNSLYGRMSKYYFDSDQCGLSHSGAQTFFALQDIDLEDFRTQLLWNKAFIPPAMVSTVDQVLSAGFNTGYWTMKEFSFVGSSVVFDEIQVYDTYTLALITETIKKIKKLGGRVMLMSATMPKVLCDHFLSVLPEVESIIIAEERMNIARNLWRYLDVPVEGIADELKSYLQKGKKVAVIVNDVETAKSLYKEWKVDYEAICYHSEFTMADRIEKEDKIDSCMLLFSTQAVEVSLDIDFDIIFSECAPLDSLIQRAGRCNRNGHKKDSEFIIFRASDIALEKVYKKSKVILQKTEQIIKDNQKRLSEREIMNMLEEIYNGYTIYDESYERARRLYDMVAEEEMFFDLSLSEEKLNTREFDYIKVSIIPVKFIEEVEELVKTKQYAKIALYEVPIGIYKYRKLIENGRREKNQFNLPIINIGYSSETGIIMEEVTDSYLNY